MADADVCKAFLTADLSARRQRPASAYSAQPRQSHRRAARPTSKSQHREECCVCLRRTSERTSCGHSLCGYCARRLRRQMCPYCRRELEPAQLCEGAGGAVSSTAPGGRSNSVGESKADLPDTSAEVAKFWHALRECSTISDLHEAVAALAPCLKQQPPTARKTLLAAATRRCCGLLLDGREWSSGSLELAAASVPFLVGLHEENLFEPAREVQLAVLDALVGLCSGGATTKQRPQSGRREAIPLSARSRGSAEAGTAAASVSTALLQKSVQQWVQRTRLLGILAEAGLLPVDGAASVANLLEGELRRRLDRTTLDDLVQLVALFREGGVWIARALSEPPGVVAECVRNTVEGALHMAEVTSSSSSAASAISTRQVLHQQGLVAAKASAARTEAAAVARRSRPQSAALQRRGRPASAPGYMTARRCSARRVQAELPATPKAAPETVLDLPPEILEPIRARALAPMGVLRI